MAHHLNCFWVYRPVFFHYLRSLQRAYFFKRTYICAYLSNDVRLNQAQYLSSLSNGHKPQLLVCKCRELQRNFSVLEAVKSVQPSFVTLSKKFFKNLFAYIPIFGSIRYEHEGCLWFKTFDEIDVDEFIKLFDLPDTFYSRFRIMELHVWMLLFSLPKEGRIDTHIKNGIIKTMWRDAEARAKLLDKYNRHMKADFRILYNKFKVSLIIYDNGFGKSDTALSSALWYNFFDGKNVDPRLLEGLVEYIRYEIHKLSKLNYEELRKDPDKEGIWSSPRPYLRHLKN